MSVSRSAFARAPARPPLRCRDGHSRAVARRARWPPRRRHPGCPVFVKICGVTNEEDALLAVAMGADAVGFVLATSPRQVAIGAARDFARRLPPEVITVGVFRDALAQ
ncbi:MAG: hypothetical protein ACLQAN_08705, partial [Acidimicrobiales bacterium]